MRNSFFISGLVLFLILCAHGPVQAQPNDPCPEANMALQNTPDDLSKVQADIDRFTLCLERAQLLQRLNALATENEEALLGADASNPGFSLDSTDDFIPFDREAVLGAGDDPIASQQGTGEGNDLIIDTDDWVILSVFGAGQNLSAKLAKKDGLFAQVKAGEVLPDGASVVSISSSSVVIREDGAQRDIFWYERR